VTARMVRAIAVAVVAVVGLAIAPAAGAAGAAGPNTKISVDDNFFKPKKVTVEVGDRVTWKWDGYVAHNVTVEKGPQKFKSKTQSDGKFSRVIRKAGVYRIVCTLHPGMAMKLTAVKPPPPPATAPTAAPSS
jgi:plastocyanin